MLPCRATPRTRERQRAPDPRHQPRLTKVWNQPGSRERNKKKGPHPRTYQVYYLPRRRNERGAHDARRRHTYPHPSSCLTGRNATESRRRERQRHTPGRRQGKSACQGEGRAEEREKSNEAARERRGSQQPSKGLAQGRGHGRHTAHGGHHTAPKHWRGEHQVDKRKAAPRTTTRTAQTPHTLHTPTSAPTARGQRAPAARPVGGQPGEGERLTPDAPHYGGRQPAKGRPTATLTARNAGLQGRAPWGGYWVPTPAPTAPGTHGLRNPGCLLQRTGGRGRDSA